MIPYSYFDKLARNVAYCSNCHTEIESKHRHDFVSCKCGNISVDGGLAYLRRNVRDFTKFIERSVYRPPTSDELRYEIAKATNDLAYGLYSKDHSIEVKKKAQELLMDLYGQQ